ncbi:hypothetical protein GSI_00588 [Ganoderma sinense ZZ0214-1]|uniref:F-box domain-containing protein n=1 Tax=Ganoderma sinense ZZ0214-1 TaxID=1077348 RepID=A0A2G8STJ9_9APHY|nr:hypothetical protein GSI_00588 [Ganoderma sinense ZZ0214-1]
MTLGQVSHVFQRTSSLMSLDRATRHAIFDLLAPTDLANVALVCSALDAEVAAYWKHQLATLAARFVEHPQALLSTMQDYRVVFSGSAVLAALLRARWRPGDLDVYCPAEFFLAVVYHFANIQGYQLENPEVLGYEDDEAHPGGPPGWALGYGGAPHIQSVAHMRKGDMEVDIIQSVTTSAIEPIAAFWTTAVQNFMSPKVFCMAYPTLTEQQCGLLAPVHLVDTELPPPRIIELIRKYERRNFRFAVRPYALQEPRTCLGQSSPDCPSSVRFFGDGHSTIFKTMGVNERLHNPGWMDVLRRENVIWWRGGRVCGEECGTVGMRVWPGLVSDHGVHATTGGL